MSETPKTPGLQEVRPPLRELLTIAVPTIATMASFSAMQFVDALMVAQIGPEPAYVAAQGNGGMTNWVVLSVFFGVTSVINTYVSQNLGAGTAERGARYAWAGIWGGVATWPLMLVAAALVPLLFGGVEVFGLTLGFNHTGELRRLETSYAQVLLVGSLLKLVVKPISEFHFGIHKPSVVTYAVVASNLANVVANYVLIFGRVSVPALDPHVPGWSAVTELLRPIDDALPPLGVTGAAYGTLVGYAVEIAIQLLVFLGPRYNAAYQTRAAARSWRREARDIARLGWPAGLQMGSETVCWWILTGYLLGAGGAAAARAAGITDPALVAEAAEVENAVGWIALRYMHASFMPTVGLSIAITAIVGRYMGMNRPDIAERRSWYALAVAGGYMGLCAVLMVVLREPLIALFVDDSAPPAARERMLDVGGKVMIAGALFQLFDSVGIMLIGSLRGAGDTKWPGVAAVVCGWVFIVGMGFGIVELLPELGSLGPWIGAAVFIAVLGVTMLARFVFGPWRTYRLTEGGGDASTPGEPGEPGSERDGFEGRATNDLAGQATLAGATPSVTAGEPLAERGHETPDGLSL
ncbi:MAG: MATE family efflux transporter [Planctomycetota bacterium]